MLGNVQEHRRGNFLTLTRSLKFKFSNFQKSLSTLMNFNKLIEASGLIEIRRSMKLLLAKT